MACKHDKNCFQLFTNSFLFAIPGQYWLLSKTCAILIETRRCFQIWSPYVYYFSKCIRLCTFFINTFDLYRSTFTWFNFCVKFGIKTLRIERPTVQNFLRYS